MTEAIVTAKCVSCGHKRDIKAGEVPRDDMPECPKCYSFMVAVSAKQKRWRG